MIIDIYNKVRSENLLKEELDLVQELVDSKNNPALFSIIRQLDSSLSYYKSKSTELANSIDNIYKILVGWHEQ